MLTLCFLREVINEQYRRAGMPATVFTTPANWTKAVIDANGLQDANTVKVGPTGRHGTDGAGLGLGTSCRCTERCWRPASERGRRPGPRRDNADIEAIQTGVAAIPRTRIRNASNCRSDCDRPFDKELARVRRTAQQDQPWIASEGWYRWHSQRRHRRAHELSRILCICSTNAAVVFQSTSALGYPSPAYDPEAGSSELHCVDRRRRDDHALGEAWKSRH